MDNEEDKKGTVINNNQLNKKVKKKYFRVEKNRFNASTLREKESKKIFKTQKEYHFSKRKALRELRRLKFHKSKKFITTTKENAHIHSDKESNSYIVQKIIPKKLKIIKDNKKVSKNINYFSKSNNNVLFNQNNNFLLSLFNSEKNNYNIENNNNNDNNIKIDEKNLNCYKIKLMLVYFYSIKNLCKYINNNFFNMPADDNKVLDEFLHQVYQDLQILNRKINEFKNFQKMNDNIKVNKEEFKDIYSLKENLLLMKIALNNSMSKNLLNIYVNIDDFCRLFSFS